MPKPTTLADKFAALSEEQRDAFERRIDAALEPPAAPDVMAASEVAAAYDAMDADGQARLSQQIRRQGERATRRAEREAARPSG